MSLNVKTRKVDGVVIIDLSGRLTIGEPVLLLRETLRVQVNDGARNFILNLGDVAYIDSSGLGELVSAYTTVRNKQGDVKLLNLTAKAKDLLQMTKLLTVFDVYDEEAKAVSALRASSPKTSVESPHKMAEVRGSRTHRTPVPRRPTGFEGQESHRTLLTSKRSIISKLWRTSTKS